MRMSSAAQDALRKAIEPLDTQERRDAYRRGEFPRADRCKDRNMRYRWDLLYASGVLLTLYENLDDSHIDTALRAIVKPL